MFIITLQLQLCIDDVCSLVSILEGTRLPIPLCSTDLTAYELPGDGTVAGFIQDLGDKVGDTAVDVVLHKFGLNVSRLLCI